ncbi:hypothetical protein ACFQH1_07945 [Lactiplantibacillus daoliensis]|uniref:Uncharacterized protein n=1 Tax=Lactiplantibacillus daoliensis TaxID=2559916 RepID=A0ABW1UGB3_9LACO|nr:hypothetical protein [Lactiplantibacillus daoliensis]
MKSDIRVAGTQQKWPRGASPLTTLTDSDLNVQSAQSSKRS